MSSDLFQALQASLSDRYRIEHELGGGGISRACVVSETAIVRRVVLATLPPMLAGTDKVERFRQKI